MVAEEPEGRVQQHRRVIRHDERHLTELRTQLADFTRWRAAYLTGDEKGETQGLSPANDVLSQLPALKFVRTPMLLPSEQ